MHGFNCVCLVSVLFTIKSCCTNLYINKRIIKIDRIDRNGVNEESAESSPVGTLLNIELRTGSAIAE